MEVFLKKGFLQDQLALAKSKIQEFEDEQGKIIEGGTERIRLYYSGLKAKKDAWQHFADGVVFQVEGEFSKAVDQFALAIALYPELIIALRHWGLVLCSLARMENKPEKLLAAAELFKEALQIDPDDQRSLNGLGNVWVQLGVRTGERSYFKSALEKYERASQGTESLHVILNNWAAALCKLGSLSNDPQLLDLAIEKLQTCLELQPNYRKPLLNWGVALTYKGMQMKDTTLLRQSIEIIKEFLLYRPESALAYGNWAANLLQIAKLSPEANLYELAVEKTQQALAINPQNWTSHYNLGVALFGLGKLNGDAQMLDKSCASFFKARELGGSVYDLACLHAYRGERKEALATLELALRQNECSVEEVLQDEEWGDFLENPDFLRVVVVWPPINRTI